MAERARIVITGAGGLVGQNLCDELAAEFDLVAIDKDKAALGLLEKRFPGVRAVCADLSLPGAWETELAGAQAVVLLHAQISDKSHEAFDRNNVEATRRVLESAERVRVPYLVHFSSSVVISVGNDDYTNTKKAQERLVEASPVPHVILRPPLMYGPSDKKHLGWIASFMESSPVFPIPGDGLFVRQPLFVKDVCKVVRVCLHKKPLGVRNVIGREKIAYIELVRLIRKQRGLRTAIVCVPVLLFEWAMRVYGWFSSRPPFTPDQLKALLAGDEFPVEPWWDEFGVEYTTVADGFAQTYGLSRGEKKNGAP